MKAFLIFAFILFLLNVGISLTHGGKDHPRKRSDVSLGVDIVCLVVNIGISIWAGYLLF